MPARAPKIRSNWQVGEVASLAGLKPEKAQKKIDSINEGGEVAQDYPIFPDERSCNDSCWVLAFLVVILAIGGCAATYGRDITSPTVDNTATLTPTARLLQAGVYDTPAAMEFSNSYLVQPRSLSLVNETTTAPYFDAKKVQPVYLVLATAAASAVAVVVAFFLIFLSAHCGTCVVYTSLLFSCAMMVVMGIVLITGGAAMSSLPASFSWIGVVLGCIMIAAGCCSAVCILCCWQKFIAFTAEVVTNCGEITLDNPCMLFVALLGAFFSAVWSIAVAFAMDGFVAEYQQEIIGEKYTQYAVFGGFFFCWIWGCMVSAGVCYTTFCGVFGRWYYSDEEPENYESGVITSSFCAASTQSLGSICFGTFLVAFIRTAEFVARQMQQDAMREGNMVVCLIMCCIRCVLDCIGDIVEYFNEWAYVQCAIRNTSFCDSAKIVYSLCTVANIWALWATLLIDSVVNFGSFMAGFAGAVTAAGVGYVANVETCLLGALCGFVAGMSCGQCCMRVFTAGAKTLATCWAENPETLMHKSHETDIGSWFQEKGGLNNQM